MTGMDSILYIFYQIMEYHYDFNATPCCRKVNRHKSRLEEQRKYVNQLGKNIKGNYHGEKVFDFLLESDRP